MRSLLFICATLSIGSLADEILLQKIQFQNRTYLAATAFGRHLEAMRQSSGSPPQRLIDSKPMAISPKQLAELIKAAGFDFVYQETISEKPERTVDYAERFNALFERASKGLPLSNPTRMLVLFEITDEGPRLVGVAASDSFRPSRGESIVEEQQFSLSIEKEIRQHLEKSDETLESDIFRVNHSLIVRQSDRRLVPFLLWLGLSSGIFGDAAGAPLTSELLSVIKYSRGPLLIFCYPDMEDTYTRQKFQTIKKLGNSERLMVASPNDHEMMVRNWMDRFQARLIEDTQVLEVTTDMLLLTHQTNASVDCLIELANQADPNSLLGQVNLAL